MSAKTVTAEAILERLAAKDNWVGSDVQPENTLSYDQIMAATGMKRAAVAMKLKRSGVVPVAKFGRNKVAFAPADVEKAFFGRE